MRKLNELEREYVFSVVEQVLQDTSALYRDEDIEEDEYWFVQQKVGGRMYLQSTSQAENDYNDVHILNPISIKKGYTRLVIIPSKADYVIKLPIGGIAYDCVDDCWDAEGTEYLHTMDYNVRDYCEEEVQVYKNIKDEFKQSFLEIEYLGSTEEGLKVYVQPKIDCTFGEADCCTDEDEDEKITSVITQSIDECENELNLAFVKECIDYYGEEYTQNFLYLMVIENFMEDMHNDNYGFIDNKPIILDYVGYRR